MNDVALYTVNYWNTAAVQRDIATLWIVQEKGVSRFLHRCTLASLGLSQDVQ